jgi:hypothetical protein
MQITASTLISKINSFNRSEYDSRVNGLLDGFLEAVREVQAVEAIAESDIIKKLIGKCESRVKEMDARLLTERKLSDLDRENLLDRKELYRDFMSTFDPGKRYEDIDRAIDSLIE